MRREAAVSFAIVLAVLVLACSCELYFESRNGSPSIERMNILVYGNDYSNSLFGGKRVNPLFGTVNDATQVGRAFEALAKETGLPCRAHYILGSKYNRKGVGFGYSIPNAIETPDTDTRMSNFKAAIESIANESTEKDLTVVFVSCHGYYDAPKNTVAHYAKAQSTYFVTSSNEGDECELYSHEAFLEDVSRIKGAKLIIADVCHSGGIVEPNYIALGRGEYKNANVASIFFENDRIDLDPSMFCLSASRYYEESFEYITSDSDAKSRTHGYFTMALLEALGWNGEKFTGNARAAKNGRLTFLDLACYVVKNDGEHKQNPMFSNGSNDIVLFDF